LKPKSLECEWDKVRHALEKCSPELHDSIDKLYNDAPASKQSKLKAILASYSYGELVVSEGIPYLPNQQKFPKDFIISSSLPLGIIVKGTMDIVDSQPTNPSRNNKESASIAQLFEGDMMGIFEALDYSGVGKSYAQPEWTIYAGINSILPIVDINTDGRAKKLNRLYKADITKTNFDNKKLFGQSASEIHKILYENYAHISEDSKLKNLYTEDEKMTNSFSAMIGGPEGRMYSTSLLKHIMLLKHVPSIPSLHKYILYNS
jgi:hypothetical protein